MLPTLPLKPVIVFLLLLGTGCASHLHNAGNQILSQQAQEQFETLTKSNQAIFESLQTNLITVSKINSELYASMAAKEAEIQVRQASRLTWQQLRDSFGSDPDKNPLLDLNRQISAKTNQVNEQLKKVRGDSKEALRIVAQTGNELAAAKATVTSWNRRVAVLDKLIAATPSIKEALQQVKAPDDFRQKVEAYTSALKNTLGEQTVVHLDADGNSHTNNLASEIQTMLNLNPLSIDPDTDGKIFESLRTTFNPKAPGLLVTVATLARDLAEAESTRLSLQLDSLESRLHGLEAARRAVEFGTNLSLEATSSIPADFADDANAQQTIASMAHAATPDRDKIAAGMLALSHYVVIQSHIVAKVEEALMHDAYQQHLESIRTSQVNLRQHESMEAHGIESLLVYHSGGIKPQEVAELAFQVVQLGLLSWIGVGIN